LNFCDFQSQFSQKCNISQKKVYLFSLTEYLLSVSSICSNSLAWSVVQRWCSGAYYSLFRLKTIAAFGKNPAQIWSPWNLVHKLSFSGTSCSIVPLSRQSNIGSKWSWFLSLFWKKFLHSQVPFQLVNLPLKFLNFWQILYCCYVKNLEIKKIKWQIDELEFGLREIWSFVPLPENQHSISVAFFQNQLSANNWIFSY
jgi:hypothetical protein